MNEIVRLFYSRIVICVLNWFFNLHYSPIKIFSRRSSAHKDLQFHFLFSDLDLGMEVSDSVTTQALSQLVKSYSLLKRFLPFLGELEVYTHSERLRLRELLAEYPGLYDKLRDFRKVNWIKGKLKEKNRNFYHRFKDHRALKILKGRYHASSVYKIYFLASDDLLAHGNLTWNELSAADSFGFSNKICCDYLSRAFYWPSAIEERRALLLLLACAPTASRNSPELDCLALQFRQAQPKVQKIFENLNELEFIIAQAHVRGSTKSEAWHLPWLKRLKSGFATTNVS